MIEITPSNFTEKVLQNKQLTIVDFWAEWCAPCRMLAPILEDLDKTYKGRLTIGKLDIKTYDQIAKEHHVSSIPTLIFFQDGVEKERIIGLQSKAYIEAIIEKHLIS